MKETRLMYAKLYQEASEKEKLKDPLKNFKVYYEEFKSELEKPTKTKKDKETN